MDSLKVIDLFAGAGGLSQGFRDAEFDIISAVEINKNLSHTYKKNFPKTKLFEEDIIKIIVSHRKESMSKCNRVFKLDESGFNEVK